MAGVALGRVSRLLSGVWTRFKIRSISPFNDEFIDARYGAGGGSICLLTVILQTGEDESTL